MVYRLKITGYILQNNGGDFLANSTSISQFKKRVMNAVTHDDALFYAFDAKECENGGDLENTRIFTYNKIPETVIQVNTYMTIMVHTKARDRKCTYITPSLEIWIYCHNDHMKMDRRITKDNRCDYISMLLDEMFNGSTEYGGIGELKLTLNTEGVYSKEFMFRHLIFETSDINNSMCGSW